MRYEVSSGAVVFTKIDNQIYFVIIESLIGDYGFPKGHIEGNETERETAIREIYEEVGIRPKIIKGFRTSDEHIIPSKKDVSKKITYFLAEYCNQEICHQEDELEGAYLMTYEEAIKAFQFESSKRILKEAMEFIKKNSLG